MANARPEKKAEPWKDPQSTPYIRIQRVTKKFGAVTAVNDISRELGGTLGVAIIGSIFLSLYSPRIAEGFGRIPGLVSALPASALDQARDSVGAAYALALANPTGVRAQAIDAVSDSFMRGFSAACLVGSAIAFVGSLLALRFLPPRSTPEGETA